MSDRLVWIVAVAILATVCIITLFGLRKRRSRAALLTTTVAQPQDIKVDALRQVREKTKEEDLRAGSEGRLFRLPVAQLA